MSLKSMLLVILQFGSFLFFALAGNLFANGFLLLIQILSLLLGLWGVIAMKMGNFNIQPEVKGTAMMVTTGPYKLLRNPMYSGLILFFGISVLTHFNTLRFLIFLLLTTVLILKIFMEEQFLEKRFGNTYTNYKKNTFRLIPFIF